MDPYHRWLIDRRIACYEAGYPASEACYDSIEDYLKDNPWDVSCITNPAPSVGAGTT
jgi:hypothetical protein